MCVYIHVCACRSQDNLRCHPQNLSLAGSVSIRLAGQCAPEIFLSLPPSTGITSMCRHTQLFYVGSRGQTQVLELHQVRSVLPSPERPRQKVLLPFLAPCCKPRPVSATSHYHSNHPCSSSIVNQLVAGSFDSEAEVFALREVRLPFPPRSHISRYLSSLTETWISTRSVPTPFTATRRD